MKIKDILKFNRDAFFDGAVQIDWYYDEAKRKDVSKSYVFHGKDYHGVERKNLIDTASYVKRIVEKLYKDKKGGILIYGSFNFSKNVKCLWKQSGLCSGRRR